MPKAWSETWTFLDGDWHHGNPPILGPRSQAFWLGSSVFDGARAFDGVAPDIDRHAARVNRSAVALGLQPTQSVETICGLVRDGLKRFDGQVPIYIRPMYWAEDAAYSIIPDPDSTRFLLSLYVSPMLAPTGHGLGLSRFRRPTLETMPTDAKAGCLYPNNARALAEVRARGFENAVVLDMLGNVAETATSNLFMVKDGVVMTPALNGCFLAGITRDRTISLLREAGNAVIERTLTVADFAAADEIFTTGNANKIIPVTRLEDRHFQPGPVGQKARTLYWDWARDTGAVH